MTLTRLAEGPVDVVVVPLCGIRVGAGPKRGSQYRGELAGEEPAIDARRSASCRVHVVSAEHDPTQSSAIDELEPRCQSSELRVLCAHHVSRREARNRRSWSDIVGLQWSSRFELGRDEVAVVHVRPSCRCSPPTRAPPAPWESTLHQRREACQCALSGFGLSKCAGISPSHSTPDSL